jgi:hypothetical protein
MGWAAGTRAFREVLVVQKVIKFGEGSADTLRILDPNGGNLSRF